MSKKLMAAYPDLLRAAKAVSESGIDEIMFACCFEIPPCFAAALRQLDAAIAKVDAIIEAEGGGA